MKHKTDLKWAHPLVQAWFSSQFDTVTEPQLQGWPAILAEQHTLISAPTGSGKTLAAFLICLDKLVRQALTQQLPDDTAVVYISPLKALSNDIQKNLLTPLREIEALAAAQGIPMASIRVEVRTGDTPAKDRQRMLKTPPHILVTTPESFYILLTAEKSRLMLSHVKTVIVDEIHALIQNKRGTHLSLSLERLEALVAKPFVRIGLSATQKPLETVAHFLTGNGRSLPVVVNIGHIKPMQLDIVVPQNELGPVASHALWDELYDKAAEIAKQHRTTLIFVNTRRLAERVSHHLAEHLGEEQVAAHHGSLSRKLRHQAETKLKNGELKVLVATASLELGIDIGSVDRVILLGSPRTISASLQRIGRAGHWHGAISKGSIFATTRNELLECAALVYAIRQGDLDQLIIPAEPLDVLSQQIVAACAAAEWNEHALYQMVCRAYPYRHLSLATFNQILHMLAEGVAGSRGRYGAYLFRDQVNKKVRVRRGSRITAIMNGGAIPETGLFTVIAEPANTMVGTLDEDFAVESNRGDIILLGATSWQIKHIENKTSKVYVEDAHGAPPSVPFWRGEAPGRSAELSMQVARLKEKISDFLPPDLPLISNNQPSASVLPAITWLQENCGLDSAGAEQLLAYVQAGRAVLGAVPTQKTIIAERFFDESGGMQLIIHSPFGSRINKAWGLALRKKFCRSFNFELQAAATDDGINIALTEQHSFPLADVFHFLHPNTIQAVLVQAVLQTPIFAARWRAAAMRALALPRFRIGRKIPPNILRMLSDDLLAAVFPDAAACQDNLAGQNIVLPDHPLIHETMKEILSDALDVEGLTRLLTDMINGKIQCLAVDTPMPSVFSHEILNANPYAFLDDAPLEERRARAVEMRRILPETLREKVGRLDQAAIEAVTQQAWPDIQNTDELHDFLQTVIIYPWAFSPPPAAWQTFFKDLKKENRVNECKIDNQIYWFAVEKSSVVQALYPMISVDGLFAAEEMPERQEALLMLLRGWLFHLGPVTGSELSGWLNIPAEEISHALIKLEVSGLIYAVIFVCKQQRWNGVSADCWRVFTA